MSTQTWPHGASGSADRPQLAIACDQMLWGDALFHLLEAEFAIGAVMFDGRLLLRHVQDAKPAIVLLDFALPGLNGIDVTAQLTQGQVHSKVMFVSDRLNPAFIRSVFDVGGWGCVSKKDNSLELVRAIRCVLAGRPYLSRRARLSMPDESPGPASAKFNLHRSALTLRQREVLQLVAEGRSNKEISRELHLSLKTIEFHRASISRQLKLSTTAELTRYFLSAEFITSIGKVNSASRGGFRSSLDDIKNIAWRQEE